MKLALVAVLASSCAGSKPAVESARSDPVGPVAAAPLPSVEPAPEVEPPKPDLAQVVPVTDAADDPRPAGAATVSRSKPVAGRRPQPTGHMEIPAIGLSHATYEGIDLAIINHGPSHWPGTALPGERGNTVFPGHRTTYSRPFWDIDRLRSGDHVIFTTAAGRFTYVVSETFVVDDQATWITDPTSDATFTIFACHPKGSAQQRYVVKGSLLTSATTTTAPRSTTTTAPPPDNSLLPGLLG